MSIDAETRARLLRLPRAAISAALFGDSDKGEDDPQLTSLPAAGAFVTLRKGGQLRGCIGTFDGNRGLAETIRTMAVSAARDPRFTHCPISAEELKDIDIEVSVLSPLKRIHDPLDFEIGRHGILVRSGIHSGCFLPDVATERGWTREQFLTECCAQKAGLGPDAWRLPETEVFIFTVEKFADRTQA